MSCAGDAGSLPADPSDSKKISSPSPSPVAFRRSALKTAEQTTLAATGKPAHPGLKAAEEALKVATAASLGGLIAGLAAGASVHTCATPYPPIPHGPGVVVDGSTKVLINNLPACFQGNTLVEALGPANQIAMGCPQVLIGSD